MRAQGIRSFCREIRLTRWRIKRMGELLDRWDEYEALQAAPPDIRRTVVEKPDLSRELVKDLHTFLVSRLGELEEMWERRN